MGPAVRECAGSSEEDERGRAEVRHPASEEDGGRWSACGHTRIDAHVIDGHQDHHRAADDVDGAQARARSIGDAHRRPILQTPRWKRRELGPCSRPARPSRPSPRTRCSVVPPSGLPRSTRRAFRRFAWLPVPRRSLLITFSTAARLDAAWPDRGDRRRCSFSTRSRSRSHTSALGAGTGALILFGAVQATMLAAGAVVGRAAARRAMAGADPRPRRSRLTSSCRASPRLHRSAPR